jgi:hypothetical protein
MIKTIDIDEESNAIFSTPDIVLWVTIKDKLSA